MAEQQQPETTETPTAEATEAPASRWEDILAEASATEDSPDDDDNDDSEDDGESEATEASADAKAPKDKATVIEKKRWQDLEKPTPAKLAIRERLAARQGQQEAAKTTQQLQSQLEAERARLTQLTTQQQQADARFRELVEEGKVDEALKVKGVSTTVGDLSRALLKAKGALPAGGKDPRVDQLERQLQSFVSAEQQRITQAKQAQAELERRQVEEQDIADLTEEIAALPYDGADALAKFPRFAEYVYRGVVEGRDTESVVRDMRSQYQQVFHDLCKAALDGAFEFPDGISAAPQGKGTKPATQQVVPPRGSAKAPRTGLPEELRHNGEARWKAILKGQL